MQTLEELYASLETFDQAKAIPVPMDGSQLVMFKLEVGWNVGLKDKDDSELVEAYLSIGPEKTYQLTKEAALGCIRKIGIPDTYVYRTPAALIQSHLNYWASHSPDISLRLLVRESEALATVRGHIDPIPNSTLLTEAISELHKIYGTDGIVAVEPHTHHSLNLTTIRLRLPQPETIPDGLDDWTSGLQIQNSLTNRKIINIAPLPNSSSEQVAMQSAHALSSYNRKVNSMDGFTEWVKTATQVADKASDHDFEILDSLIMEEVPALSPVLADTFRTYQVPLKARAHVIDTFTLANLDTVTYYDVVDALMRSADAPGMTPKQINNVLASAGHFASSAAHRCSSCHRSFGA